LAFAHFAVDWRCGKRRVLEFNNTDFAAGAGSDLKLGADLRRETYLIFKESVNNAVRHAACTEIDVQLAVSHRWIELTVKDNGKGFEDAGKDGNGLASMYLRASQLGGVLKVTSAAGLGTAVSLRAPADPRRGF
jgi:signal transduction histidine kinase